MLEYWIVVTIGVIVVVVALCLTYLFAESRELRMVRSRYRLKVYEELFHAITDMNVAGSDEYRLDRAKKRMAFTLNRLNLVASEEVLKRVNELLDFLNEAAEGNLDLLRQLNLLNAIVIAARKDLDPASARAIEASGFRFKFYTPARE
ncbi:MAG TPA: hypothetical protein PLN56_00120 [Methanoregulaceae archaeon]|nr:MAG: hypothetical protein IPI71_05495 [Methanolinea sp.]HON80658.1 hypothetical protein [Methanoregulaceae archaeon]HPD09392.1 hypothetical protein [Methanoregulaceae archaeon]HRT14815.1 hypothetical protein [Methanoregulaceae archaeon]HRU30388.1 hypothetical protein [Methanoregulaceae archaeon]